MQVNPYLFYNGNCEAAFKYYEKVLGAKIEAMLTHEGAPESMPVPPEWKKKIMHAKISIDGEVLMASDAPPGHFHQPQGFFGLADGRGPQRRRTQVQGLGRGRRGEHAVWQDVLGQGIRHVRRIGSAFPGWSTARRKIEASSARGIDRREFASA